MTSERLHSPTEWQWDDCLWGDSPTAPTSPDLAPDPNDECPGWLRRVLRWADRPT